MGKAAARCPCGLCFSIAELSCFKCSWLTLHISTPSHFPSCQMSPSPWVLLTLSFVQAAFWSHHVTIVDILKPSSCLAFTDNMSASLFFISCGYPPWLLWHRFLLFILTTSFLFGDCLLLSSPYNLSYVCSVPYFLEVILEEESSYSVQLRPPPWATYPLDLHIQLGSVTNSKPACHSLSGSPFRSTIHPVTQARNLGLVLDFFPLPLVSHLKLSLLDLISSLL